MSGNVDRRRGTDMGRHRGAMATASASGTGKTRGMMPAPSGIVRPPPWFPRSSGLYNYQLQGSKGETPDHVPPKPKDDIERFDRWAATYDRSVRQRWYFRPVHSAMLDLIDRVKPIEPHGSVLDIGCGTGRLLRTAASRWPGTRLFGVDPAERMISEAARLSPNAAFHVACAEGLPFPDRSMDLVLSSLSFHHWADQSKGLREIQRVLRPGGLFALADHTFWVGRLFNERIRGRRAVHALIGAAGLTVVAHRKMRLRFVLLTLAVSPPSAEPASAPPEVLDTPV